MVDLCNSFFDGASAPTSISLDLVKFEEKIFIILNWAMGLRYLGVHRPYACHTLLRLWMEQRAEHLARPFDIFPQLYSWLDSAPAAKKERNVQAIGITFGEFTRQGMFSYSQYLHTLIARGYTARSRAGAERSHHMDLLRSMPIFVQARDLLQQRRIALSGDDIEVRLNDDKEEETAVEAFKEECKEYVPELYGFSKSSQRLLSPR
jgi:mediator of RNA polymerase II transcription subunit 12